MNIRPSLISREIVHKNPWYQVRHDTLQYPDHVGHYYVTETPKTVLIIAKQGDAVLLVTQYRYTMEKDSLEFPSGTIKPGETVENAARRELREETGFEATHLKMLGSFYSLNGFANNHVHVFYTNALRNKGKTHLDDSEQDLRIRWTKITDLPTLMLDQTIQDGESMAAWMLVLAEQAVKQTI